MPAVLQLHTTWTSKMSGFIHTRVANLETKTRARSNLLKNIGASAHPILLSKREQCVWYIKLHLHS